MSLESSSLHQSEAKHGLGLGSQGSVPQDGQGEQPSSPSVEEIVAVEIPRETDPRFQKRTVLVDSLIRECKCDLSGDEYLKAVRYAGPVLQSVFLPRKSQSLTLLRASSPSTSSPLRTELRPSPDQREIRAAGSADLTSALLRELGSAAIRVPELANRLDWYEADRIKGEEKTLRLQECVANLEGKANYSLGLFRAQELLLERFKEGKDLPEPCEDPEAFDSSFYYSDSEDAAED
ncbi:unnamed protein product [Cuscuta campestris]|uniref:Uncharacterized protein n=1 Tax=Cuscuta campestris TaxID=132261 RepID=A0A484KSI9_9ASTE|nr:unnamed protein product [Cuscuta campestris]